jgi:hypothetical protein
MSNKPTNAGEVPAKEDKAAVLDKADVIKNAKAFGTTPELMAGALAMVKKDHITRQEARNAVAAFRKRPVERGK